MWTRLAVVMALAGIALAFASPAFADRAQESALAERYSPVVRLVAHTDCAPGKPYLPINVDLLFDEPTVALRGPWGPGDLVKIGPSAKDLSNGLFEYHLDFPGSALQPGCDYLHWERRLVMGQSPTVYAHVATNPERPRKLALQYWLFYVFNDWNNLHEGDWEMIQLVFDASTPAEALERPPVEVGYSQHEGAERAAWGDDKLERVDGTHPVVHPASGSHANFYGESLYLGSSAEQGVGCDDTRGPTFDIRPAVETIPSDPALARAEFPWIAFEGRWGELRPAFFNGPTGPNLKNSGRSRSAGRRAGAHAATSFPAEARSEPGRPISSAAPSPAGREGWCGSSTNRSRLASCSPGSCCSSSSCFHARRGGRALRSVSHGAGRGARSLPPPGACTYNGFSSSSAWVFCWCRSRCS